MIQSVTQMNKALLKNYYDSKRLVSMFGLTARRIACCVQGCMLLYDNEYGKNDGALICCKFCDMPLSSPKNKSKCKKKHVPVKTMFYLHIIPRLQRLFALIETASHMFWHHENRSSLGVLRHPLNDEAWKHFHWVYPDFVVNPRNVHLGLRFDGFNRENC